MLAAGALILWGIALWASWGGSCPQPNAGDGGLDKGVSVWPPAAECVDRHGGAFWHQALPWAPWLIGALIATAAVVLLIGLAVAIRDLRRPATGALAETVSAREAWVTDRGPGGDLPPTRGEVQADEREPPAMAA